MNNEPLSEDNDNPPIAIRLEDLLEVVNEGDLMLDRHVHLWKKEDMEKYKDEVFQILVDGYKQNGGLLGMESADQLVAETDYWKLCRRKGKITAVLCCSTKRGGRKTRYGSCLMTDEGKRDMLKMMQDDMEAFGGDVGPEGGRIR